MMKEVAFEPVDGPINDRIDDAYRAKYGGSPYVKPMIGARARSATVRVRPRGLTGCVARRWDSTRAYSESKLYVTALAFAVARRWPAVLSNAVDPHGRRVAIGAGRLGW